MDCMWYQTTVMLCWLYVNTFQPFHWGNSFSPIFNHVPRCTAAHFCRKPASYFSHETLLYRNVDYQQFLRMWWWDSIPLFYLQKSQVKLRSGLFQLLITNRYFSHKMLDFSRLLSWLGRKIGKRRQHCKLKTAAIQTMNLIQAVDMLVFSQLKRTA